MAYFDEIFRDMELIRKRLMESMLREFDDIEKEVRSGKLEGKWDVEPIERPGVRGYVAHGRFWSPEPMSVPQQATEEVREPLTDVFEDKETVKLYVELPGVEKDDIQLNVTEGRAEIKAKKFYKTVKLPTSDVGSEKASAEYKNGVLQVSIPKINKPDAEEKKHKIKID